MLDNYLSQIRERGYSFTLCTDCHWPVVHMAVTDGTNTVKRAVNIDLYGPCLLADIIICEVEKIIHEMEVSKGEKV